MFKGYAFEATISNTTTASVTIAITDITLDGDDLGDVSCCPNLETCTTLGSTFVVPAGTINQRVAIITQGAGNSSNGTLIITCTVDGVPDQVTVQADAAPPIVWWVLRHVHSCREDLHRSRAHHPLVRLNGRDPADRPVCRLSAVSAARRRSQFGIA